MVYVIGFVPRPDGVLEMILREVVRLCHAHDIIFTIPTGNDGTLDVSLDQRIPQSMGTDSNGLITVGGVHDTGVLASRTTFDRGKGGSTTLYAVSEQVEGASHNDNTGFTKDDGTSFAAPAVAGLGKSTRNRPE